MAAMHITRENGTVTAIEERPEGQVALVAMDPPEGGEERCATCRMCFEKEGCERLLEAEIESGAREIAAGARVEVEIAHPSLYLPIMLTFLLPLAGLCGCGALGLALTSGGLSRDIISALLAILGAIIFFRLGHAAFGKNAASQKPAARISRVL